MRGRIPGLCCALCALCALLAALGCAGFREHTPPESGTDYERIGSHLEEGQPEEALKELRRTSTLNREEQLLAVRLCLQTGKLTAARQYLDDLHSRYPGDADVLYLCFLLEEQEGSPEAAEARLAAALTADPRHSEALAARGRLCLEAGLNEEARAAFSASLESDPTQLEALLGAGKLLYSEERYAEALIYLDRAVDSAPDFPFAYQDRARLRSALGDNAGALEDLDTAIHLEPDYYWSRLDRGRLLLRLGRLEAAGRDFEHAVALNPDIFLAYVYTAGIHEDRREYPEAIQDYETLLRLRPDYFFALESLGVLYYSTGKYEPAAMRFSEAFDNSWDEPSYALLAALACRQADLDPAVFLKGRLARIKADSWAYPLARFLAGEAGEAATLDRVQREKDTVIKARMLFYVGCAFLAEGRSPAGLVYLSTAAEKLPPHWAEARIARELSARGGM
jgi:tetratricopeptide (TPR) repeat protein